MELGTTPRTPVIPITRRLWTKRLFALSVLMSFVGVYITVTHRQWFQGNFGIVEAGRVYRSAQPTSNLQRLINDHNIVSVLNLRGGSMRDSFYADEVQTTSRLGVAFYDLSMSATKRPSRAQLLAILDVFRKGPYPLLIHCRQGADRTGLASGLYLLSERNAPPNLAARQFTIRHGHVPVFGPEKLHEPFDEYAKYLADNQLEHTPERFHDWVAHEYVAEDALAAFQPIEPGPRVRR